MNLTPSRLRDELMSEVEKNKELLSPGDILSSAYNVYQVDDVYEHGFTTVCGDAFSYDGLQIGWRIKSAAKEKQMVYKNLDNPCYPKWMSWAERCELAS